VLYERRGFVPRERLEATLLGEPVIERRWWRAPRPGRRPAAGSGPTGDEDELPTRPIRRVPNVVDDKA